MEYLISKKKEENKNSKPKESMEDEIRNRNLINAIEIDDIEGVKSHDSEGADINVRDENGITALI